MKEPNISDEKIQQQTEKKTKKRNKEVKPVISEPVVEEPVFEDPVIEEPVIEEPLIFTEENFYRRSFLQ